MRNEELIKLRENYNELINERNKILALKSKIEKLENDPIVKEYLDTVSEYEDIKAKHVYPVEEKEGSYFYDLQEEYYETAILESEAKAIEKVNKLVK